jgi:hypothetical protein
MVSFSLETLPTEAECQQVLAMLEIGPRAVSEILTRFPSDRQALLHRGLVWLCKYGLARII